MSNLTKTTYDPVARAFHWIMAIMIIGMVAVGLYMSDLPNTPQKFQMYSLHKAIGMTVLGLVVLRILWRFHSRPPGALATHTPLEQWASHIVHFTLYGVMFLMPISGYIMSCAAGFPVVMFGHQIPSLFPVNKVLAEQMKEAHEIMGNIVIGAVALHFAGAMKHYFIDKDNTLGRMLPMFARRGITRSLLLLCALVAFGAGGARAADFPPQWAIVPEQSHLTFNATQNGAAFEGHFDKFAGMIVFDGMNLAASKLDITIDTGSVGTGAPDRDAELPKPDWFDVAKFPQARFVTNGFKMNSPTSFVAHGELTIRDKTVPVDLPFTLIIDDKTKTAHAMGEVVVKRLDFGIGWADTATVGADVTIKVDITAKRGA